jgi:hypothetical protein
VTLGGPLYEIIHVESVRRQSELIHQPDASGNGSVPPKA